MQHDITELKKKLVSFAEHFNCRVDYRQDLSISIQPLSEEEPSIIKRIYQSLAEEEKKQELYQNTLNIIHSQQLLTRLNIVISSSIAAHKAGLTGNATLQDSRLMLSPELSMKKIRKYTLTKKIYKPLKLNNTFSEKELKKGIKGLKNLLKNFSKKSLKNLNTQTICACSNTFSRNQLAEILSKTSLKNKKLSTEISKIKAKSFKNKFFSTRKENSSKHET